ncbi:MAG TPA: hypothetical protein VI795_00015 [Patescibacteria group bacterium]|nr:hypothetical protein [Patescibacteria group bacterium]
MDISALRKKKCPNCGYSKTSQEEERRTCIKVTDAEGLALAMGGENWTCSNCGSVNLKKHKKCSSCSNPKDESDHVNEVRKMTSPPPPVFTAKDEDQQWYEQEKVKEVVHPEAKRTLPVKTNWTSQPMTIITEEVSNLDPIMIRNGIVAFFAIVLLGLLGYGIFHTKSVDGTVTGFSWSRDVVIQHYVAVHHTDESSTPAGAYNITSREVSRQVPVYRTDEVPYDCSYDIPGTCTDLGNGAESCTDDTHVSKTCYNDVQVVDHYDTVWDTKYSYDLNEWIYARTEHSEGNDRKPYPPKYTVYLDGQQIIGAERVSSTPEKYVVYFEVNEKDETKVYTYSTSESEWNQYNEGDIYPLKVNLASMIINNPLQDKISAALTAQPK